MPRNPYTREKFTRERNAARKLAAEYFERFPKERYQTEVESWRELAAMGRAIAARLTPSPHWRLSDLDLATWAIAKVTGSGSA